MASKAGHQAVATVILLTLLSPFARAGEPGGNKGASKVSDELLDAEREEDLAPPFRYQSPQSSAPARAVLEELLVLGAGYVQYVSDKNANTRDFDLSYDWPSLRSKLLFQSLAFDNNHFPTNWVTHPIAGYFYYGVARANRLSVAESFLLATAASTVWEVFGEWREQASVNDLVVTPTTGMMVGESFFQLGAFMQRSRPTVATTALSWLFGSLKNANDHLDGAEVARSGRYDDLGLAADEWHRFRFSAGVGTTLQDRGAAYLDGRVEGESRLVTLPDYGRDGNHHRWFGSGEVTSLSLGLTMSSQGVADFLFSSGVMPFGYYHHDVRGAEGQTTVTGLRLAFDYGMHDFDRDRRRGIDRIAIAGAGVGLEHTLHVGASALQASCDALANFAGVEAYALPEYARVHWRDGLSSVLVNEAYYHAVGMTIHPTMRISVRRLDAGTDLRFDSFTAIAGLDREAPRTHAVAVNDQRTAVRGWVGVTFGDRVRLEASAARLNRRGRIAEISSSRGETSFLGSVGLLF